jgi:hypothetical protein
MTPVVCALALSAAQDYPVVARETVSHIFTGSKTLDISSINGAIEILGDEDKTVRVEGERIVHGADQGAVERANKEVKLHVTDQNGVAKIYVESAKDKGNRNYEIEYRFTIHVPKTMAVKLTSLSGPVRADGVTGKFLVKDVNGGVQGVNASAGSPHAKKVDGGQELRFDALRSEALNGTMQNRKLAR